VVQLHNAHQPGILLSFVRLVSKGRYPDLSLGLPLTNFDSNLAILKKVGGRTAQLHINRTTSDHTWQYRVGASSLACGHYEHAKVAFKEAESHFQNNWDLTRGLATAYGQLNDPRTSLEYIHKFKALSNQYEKSDKGYRDAHWKVLFAEGNCYTQLEDRDSAVKIYTSILSEEWGEDPNSNGIRKRAILRLFVIWSQAKSFALIIDFVRGWKRADDAGRDYTYWLSKIVSDYRIHGHIIAASKHTGSTDEMCDLYQAAIDYLTLELDASKKPYDRHPSSVGSYLQYFQAALRFYASTSEIDHDLGLRHWENVVQSADGVPGELWTIDQASQILAPHLLDKATADHSLQFFSPSDSYVSRLEALTRMGSDRIRGYQDQFDPRLCLARLYHLKGDRDLAVVQAQERLCSVFDKWPGDLFDGSLELRYKNLAPTLIVLDKDVDAIAAWQAIRPYAETDDLAIVNDKVVDVFNNEETTRAIPIRKGPKSKAYITSYGCDGSCGTWWFDVLADVWVCRNCYCVQLCPACYKKLQDDELHPMVCNKSHKLLYLPPFDKELWQTLPADMMIVDKKSVARVDWINKLREEYEVQQEQIEMIKIKKARELKARTCIARYVLRWRRRLYSLRASKKAS
jgi:tetratricopeptide (TPR) repeat protein